MVHINHMLFGQWNLVRCYGMDT